MSSFRKNKAKRVAQLTTADRAAYFRNIKRSKYRQPPASFTWVHVVVGIAAVVVLFLGGSW